MHKLVLATLTIGTLALVVAMAAPATVAEERNLGKHSQDEIKNACNKAGGELLGVSDLGSYGCEVADKGTMILCNKNNECTGYTSARTASQRKSVLNSLGLKQAAVAAAGTGTDKPKKPTHASPAA